MGQRCVKVTVRGVVQGVGFRYYTEREASRLEISGYAINLSTGDVEVLARGENDKIEQLIAWLHEGPRTARVIAVDVEECCDCVVSEGFCTG